MTKLFQTIIIFTLITSGAFADSINHDLVYFGDEQIYITKEGDNLRLKDKTTSKTLTELAAGSTSILSTNNTFTGTNEFDKGVDLQSESSNPNGATTLWNKSNQWICFGDSKINETRGNVIKVAKDGSGNYTTIQAAIDSISGSSSTNRYTILIYPGVYAEEVTLDEPYVSLVGTNKESCRIEIDASTDHGHTTIPNYLPIYPVLYVTAVGCEVQNIHVESLYGSAGSDAESALMLETTATSFHAVNCDFETGGKDTIWLWGYTANQDDITFENCYVYGDYDIISSTTSFRMMNCRLKKSVSSTAAYLWVWSKDGAITIDFFENICIAPSATYTIAHQFENATSCTFNQCSNKYYPYTYGASNATVTRNNYGTSENIETLYSVKANDYYTNSNIRIASDGEAWFTKTNTDYISINGSEITSLNTNGDISITPNGSGEVNISKVDIDAGAVDATTLSGNTTYWKDFSSVTFPGVFPYQMEAIINSEHGATPYFWYKNATENPTHVIAIGNSSTIYYPLENIAGSIITQIRAKWQAQGNGDGVKLALVKRDESGTATAWTVIGSEQTYTDTGSPYDVTVSTYNPADETMTANYSYAIRVTSVVGTTGVNLFSVGIETSKRVY